MANRIVASLLLLFLFAASAFASSDVPFIVAQKKATLKRIKPDVERISVSVDIYNRGTMTVYDVSLNDDSWPQDSFSVVSGNLSVSWEKLDDGSVLSHSYELEAKEKGVFQAGPANGVCKWGNGTGPPIEAYSTPLLPLDILAVRPAESKINLGKRLWGAYGSQASVVIIMSLFIILMNSPSSSKGSKKRR